MKSADDATNPGVRYEPRDIDVRKVVGAACAVAALGAVICVGLLGLLHVMVSSQGGAKEKYGVDQAKQSWFYLEAAGRKDVAGIREGEQKHLDGYQWIDKSRGIVRIPIDRAIEILVKEGVKE